MDQQRPAGRHARAPAADVGGGGREPVRTVDAQDVDSACDRVQGLLRRAPHVAHALRHTRTCKVRAERGVVGIALAGRSRPLSRPAVTSQACGSIATTSAASGAAADSTIVERPWSEPISTIRAPGARARRRSAQARRLVAGQPALHAVEHVRTPLDADDAVPGEELAHPGDRSRKASRGQ